jgi:hypothetical protein
MYRVEKDFEVVVCLGAMDLGLRKKVKKYFVVRVNEKRTAMRQRKAHGKVFLIHVGVEGGVEILCRARRETTAKIFVCRAFFLNARQRRIFTEQ